MHENHVERYKAFLTGGQGHNVRLPDLTVMPTDEAVKIVMLHKGIPAPRVMSHLFVPGDSSCGWGDQCCVVVPVEEGGNVVGAHCGGSPEDHVRPTYTP